LKWPSLLAKKKFGRLDFRSQSSKSSLMHIFLLFAIKLGRSQKKIPFL
jgi:hypothetical protein